MYINFIFLSGNGKTLHVNIFIYENLAELEDMKCSFTLWNWSSVTIVCY